MAIYRNNSARFRTEAMGVGVAVHRIPEQLTPVDSTSKTTRASPVEVPMRLACLVLCLLLLPVAAFAGGTVGFNVKWYPTGPWPSNDIVGGGFDATTGIVIADFNRDGILDVAYSYSCCQNG